MRQSVYLRVKNRVFKLDPAKDRFTYYISAMLIVAVLHLLAIFAGSGYPFGVLYGPLSLMAYRALNNKFSAKPGFALNIIFFLSLSSVYFVLRLPWTDTAAGKGYLDLYYTFYFIAMISSMAIHSIIPLIALIKKVHVKRKEIFLMNLFRFNIFIASLITAIIVRKHYFPEVNFGFDINLMIYVLLFIAAAMVATFIQQEIRDKRLALIMTGSGNAAITDESWPPDDEAFKRVDAVLSDPAIFRNPIISLATVSDRTGMSSHQLADIFRQQYRKTYYQILAEYRIRYAIERINTDGNISFENLCYECGFNSKSSFNRYFRAVVGATPKEYREARLKKNI